MAVTSARKVGQKKIHLNVDLATSSAQELVEMAKCQGVSLSEAVSRSIITEAFLQKKMATGAKVLIDEGGVLKEVIFLR